MLSQIEHVYQKTHNGLSVRPDKLWWPYAIDTFWLHYIHVSVLLCIKGQKKTKKAYNLQGLPFDF